MELNIRYFYNFLNYSLLYLGNINLNLFSAFSTEVKKIISKGKLVSFNLNFSYSFLKEIILKYLIFNLFL